MGFITSGSGTGTPPAWNPQPPQHSDPTPAPAFPGWNSGGPLLPPPSQEPSGMGQHPSWDQMAGAQQLPDPMQRAWEHFTNARENFLPIQQEFRGMEGSERAAAGPEFQQERNEFGQIRDWYRDLQGMTDAEARGTAAFGPPRMNSGPQFAPMLEVPQFPGMDQHDGTVQGLLGLLQKQTADQIGGGGGGGGDLWGNDSEESLLREIQRQNRLAERGITPRDTVAIHDYGGSRVSGR